MIEYGIKPNILSAWVTKYKSAEACQAADVHYKAIMIGDYNLAVTPYKKEGISETYGNRLNRCIC